jgi:hypothetical protein
MSDDLIKRLGDPNRDWPEFGHDRREAKNRIEELRLCRIADAITLIGEQRKLAEAVEALRPFADVLKGNYFHQPDTLPISMGFGHYDRRWALKLMDFRNARAVLAELEGGEEAAVTAWRGRE